MKIEIITYKLTDQIKHRSNQMGNLKSNKHTDKK